jgi:hypothetical protein
MTALQQIIKEAQAIRRKSPKMEWKKAVAQASTIYASKHKGKSPVGKKKTTKKKVGVIKKKVVKKRLIKKKATRKTASKRKPTEKAVLKSIKHAVSVQKQHMGNIGGQAIDRIKSAMSHLSHYEHTYKKYMSMPLYEKKLFAGQIKKLRHLIKETKTHITQLKKSI